MFKCEETDDDSRNNGPKKVQQNITLRLNLGTITQQFAILPLYTTIVREDVICLVEGKKNRKRE